MLFRSTLLGMMGLPVPETCDGRDLTDPIRNKRDDAVDSVPLFLPVMNWRGIYTRRYTYFMDTSGADPSPYRNMFFNQPSGWEWNGLYDRERDPAETCNLIAEASLADIREQLHQRTLEWMKQFGDTGASCKTLEETIYTEADQGALKRRQWSQFSGVLKGRPIDLLGGN